MAQLKNTIDRSALIDAIIDLAEHYLYIETDDYGLDDYQEIVGQDDFRDALINYFDYHDGKGIIKNTE